MRCMHRATFLAAQTVWAGGKREGSLLSHTRCLPALTLVPKVIAAS